MIDLDDLVIVAALITAALVVAACVLGSIT